MAMCGETRPRSICGRAAAVGRCRVVIAMSGGVDSSLAAALLVEQGFDVIGVSMRLWQPAHQEAPSGCCSLDDFLDARKVAELLEIPFYVIDFTSEFEKAVVRPFVDEYRRGRTPNPCARCNQFVKFSGLREKTRALGAEWLATGHYARISRGVDGPVLLRGVDAAKDQSYFLFGIGREALEHTLFPVGQMSKTQVRAEALRRGLPVADKADSQEICFAPPGRHADFVEQAESAVPLRPGDIVDRDGRVVGTHAGVHRYTVGQRRGLRLESGSQPRYVTEIDSARGHVRVGSIEDVSSAGLSATDACWLAERPRAGDRVAVKIRSRSPAVPAVIESADTESFTLRAPGGLRAVTPGQAAVLYDGECVLGGGWIREALQPPRAGSDEAGFPLKVAGKDG